MFTALICSLIAMACVAGNSYGPSSEDRSRARNVGGSTDTIVVARDAYLGPDGDDYWKGTTDSLVVDGVRSTRILIQADRAAIVAAIGSGTLANATLELTVQATDATWPAGGATVDAHRVLQHWTEAEVTWVCSDGNEAWDMSTGAGSIWQTAHTARTTITNGQTGLVRLDVTADVAAFLSGKANHGWLIKRTSEGATEPGRISFSSREGAPEPRLIIQVASDTTPPPASWPRLVSTLPNLDTTKVVSATGGPTLLYRANARLFFTQSASDAEKLAVVQKYSLTVLGVTPGGVVYVSFPDPGPTVSDLENLLAQMRAEPGVRNAGTILRTPLEEVADARYPTDGAGQLRADWLGSPTSTWAFRAIRAPLAWGCETGTSSSPSAARVGIVEWKHDQMHPDFSASVGALWEAPDSLLSTVQPKPADTVFARTAHATHVAGILTASGDNGLGVSGVIWRTNLRLYALYSQQQRPLPINTGFYVLSGELLRDRPRVLSLSVDGRLPANLSQAQKDVEIEGLEDDLGDMLRQAPEMLVVVAAGNERFRGSLRSYELAPQPVLMRAALLRLRSSAEFADRIIVAAGTEPGNNLWNGITVGSNVFDGLTDLAAPAKDVYVLGLRAGQSVPSEFRSGTSLAAPMVAGVAAQLLTMDPTLAPADVKRFALQGAQQPRIDPVTGMPTPAPAVQGTTQTFYQLDAYGSLALLSRELPGTPLCGAAVQVQGQNIVARYDGISPRTLYTFPSGTIPVMVRGAQGGRLLAVSYANEVQELRLSGTTWQPFGAQRPGVFYKEYLERDTVEYAYDANFLAQLRVTRRDGSVVSTSHFWQSQDPQGIIGLPEAGTTFAPSGEFATVSDEYVFLNGVGAQCLHQHRLYLFPLGGSSSTLVRNGPVVDSCVSGDQSWLAALCGPFTTTASHDGRQLAIAKNRCRFDAGLVVIEDTDVDLSPVSGTVVGTPTASVTVTGDVRRQAFSADGIFLYSEEWSNACGYARRLVSSLQSVSVAPCDGPELPRPVNLMAAHTSPPRHWGKGATRVESGVSRESRIAAHRTRHHAWLKAMPPNSRVN